MEILRKRGNPYVNNETMYQLAAGGAHGAEYDSSIGNGIWYRSTYSGRNITDELSVA